MARANTNIARALTGGTGIGNEIFTSAFTTGQTPFLQRAIVIDVIMDPDLLTEQYKENLSANVNNGDIVDIMIPNCVVAILTNANAGTGPQNTTILFPLFPSHIMFPIAPGEQVYVIYEDIIVSGIKRGYWFSRIPGYNTFEDANYTHLDRQFDPTTNPANYSTSEIENRQRESSPEIFQNGGNTESTRTIPATSNGENPYDYIFNNAQASLYITPEPVPRWKKRPQELVLQGANNSLIVLGEDRNGSINGALRDTPIDTTSVGGDPRCAGAIDMVVGRGRYMSSVGANPREVRQDNPPGENSTAPLVIDNSRGYLETNKNPFRVRKENIANPNEGNPDPIYDAARIYVVQQSKVDENYKLIPSVDGGLEYPEECIPNEQPEPNGVLGRSYVVTKADHLRLIARREPNLGDEENIAGSILIVREGNKNENQVTSDNISVAERDINAPSTTEPTTPDGNLAYILISKEGKIQLEANEIYLGRANGKGEPFVRYSAYKATIEALQSEIEALRTHINNLEINIGNAFRAAVAIPYSNIATLQAIADQPIMTAGPMPYATLNSKITNVGSTIRNTYNVHAKSTKIFGE